MEALIFYGGIALVIFFVVRSKMKKKEQWEALPDEGPMQVEIKEDSFPAGGFGSKRYACTLRIKIKISKADWKAIADMGLMKKVLFESPSPSGDVNDPSNVFQWKVEDLRIFGEGSERSGVNFADVAQMKDAKERLVEGLQTLRAYIDDKKSGGQKEKFEI